MREYKPNRFDLAKEDIFTLCQLNTDHFITIIIYGNIQKIKHHPEIVKSKQLLLSLSTDEKFGRLAINCIHQNNLEGLQYLITDCGFKELCTATDVHRITLLMEACTYSRSAMAQLLLENGAPVDAQDDYGMTALHRIAQTDNSPEMVDLLRKHNAKMNILENQGLGAIHLAALHGNLKTLKKIKESGVNPHLKTKQGNTYLDLMQKVAKKEITVSAHIVPDYDNEESKRSRVNANCICGFYLPKLNQQICLDYIKNILGFNKPLNTPETVFLFFCYFLSSHQSADKLITISEKHIKHQRFMRLDVICAFRHLSYFFLKLNDIKSAASLISQSISLLEKEPVNSIPADYCNEVAALANTIGEYSKAIRLGEMFLKHTTNDISAIKLRAFLCYNLGMSYSHINEKEKALEYFKEAHQILGNDTDSFRECIKLMIILNRLDEAKAFCEQSPHIEVSQIYLIDIEYYSGALNEAHALLKLERTFLELDSQIYALDRKCYFYARLEKFEQALICAESSYAQKSKEEDQFNTMASKFRTLLHSYLFCNEYIKAQTLIHEIEKRYSAFFAFDNELRCLVIATTFANDLFDGAHKLFSETELHQSHKDLLNILIENIVLSKLTSSNISLKERISLLNKAIVMAPNSTLLMVCKIIESFKNKTEITNRELEELDIDLPTLHSLFSYSKERDADDITLGTTTDPSLPNTDELFDPAGIHSYYQIQKRIAQQSLISHFYSYNPRCTWSVDKKSYDSNHSKMIALDSLLYPNYWAIIGDGLNLDSTQLEKYQSALEKNLCRRQHGQSGIKCLDRKIFELKRTDEDLRLWTSCVYRNPNGQYLIVFDKTANHKEMNRHVKDIKSLAVIDVPDQVKPVSAVTSSSFYLPAPATTPATTTTSSPTTLTSVATPVAVAVIPKAGKK